MRRWFKKHHAMTFQAYQRMLRLNRAIKLLGENGEVASAAFDVGYGSLSGFSSALKKATGRSPSENRMHRTGERGPSQVSARADVRGLYGSGALSS